MRKAISSLTAITGAMMIASALPANAAEVEFEGTFTGSAMVPAVETEATGRVEAVYDTETRDMRWYILYDGLISPVTAVSVYGPAGEGEAGEEITAGSPRDLPSPILGGTTISDSYLDAMLDGQLYLVLSNEQFPDGVMRAQLIPIAFEEHAGGED